MPKQGLWRVTPRIIKQSNMFDFYNQITKALQFLHL